MGLKKKYRIAMGMGMSIPLGNYRKGTNTSVPSTCVDSIGGVDAKGFSLTGKLLPTCKIYKA